MNNELNTINDQIKILKANIRSGLVRAYEANDTSFDDRYVEMNGPTFKYSNVGR